MFFWNFWLFFLVRGLNVFFFHFLCIFFGENLLFVPRVQFLCKKPQYLAHIILDFFSKNDTFSIFEFWPSFWVMGLFPTFLYHFLVFLWKNSIFAPMSSLFDLESSYLATMSYSRMFKSCIWIFDFFCKNQRWPLFFL